MDDIEKRAREEVAAIQTSVNRRFAVEVALILAIVTLGIAAVAASEAGIASDAALWIDGLLVGMLVMVLAHSAAGE